MKNLDSSVDDEHGQVQERTQRRAIWLQGKRSACRPSIVRQAVRPPYNWPGVTNGARIANPVLIDGCRAGGAVTKRLTWITGYGNWS